MLISADLQILQFRGPTGAYLEPPTGKATLDVLKMARSGLMLPLRTAINQAKKDNTSVRKDNVRVEQDGTVRTVSVQVIPLKNLRERCFLIVFEDSGRSGSAAPATQVRRGARRDGTSARLRRTERSARRRRAWGQDEDRRRSEEAGFDAHLVKPVDERALRKLLAELGPDNQEVEP